MSEVFSMHPTVQMRDVWTVDNLATLDVQDWWRYEILEGSLIVSPLANLGHERIGAALRRYLEPVLPPAWTVVGPLGVDVGQSSFFVPDLVVVTNDLPDDTAELAPADVHLAVEIESPSSLSMDRVVKPAKYAASGVEHYWRIARDPLQLHVYRLSGDVYAEVGSWGEGETAHIEAPFAVEIDVSALLGR